MLREGPAGRRTSSVGVWIGASALLLAASSGACAHSDPGPWPKEPYSLLGIAMACHQDPSVLDRWFPGDLRDPSGSHPGQRCEAAAVIRSYQEPVLPAASSGETYRLVYEPSFAPPVVIRIEAGGPALRATLKRDRSKGEDLTGSFETLEHPVDPERLELLRRAVKAAGCWDAGSVCQASSLDPENLVIADGSRWLLEGVRGTQHWAVGVAHPEESPFLSACRALIDAADARSWIPEADARPRNAATLHLDGSNPAE